MGTGQRASKRAWLWLVLLVAGWAGVGAILWGLDEPAPPAPPERAPVVTSTTAGVTTTTGASVTTTTTEAPTTTVAVVRPATTVKAAAMEFGGETVSWYRLATCESGNGAASDNQFQFMGGTAEKVGYYPGMPVAAQTKAAQGWAATLRALGISPGSDAGWPHCWWEAGGS